MEQTQEEKVVSVLFGIAEKKAELPADKKKKPKVVKKQQN
jgi:hypothetical protein